MKYKVSELEGDLLDAAVALMEGHATLEHFRPYFGPGQRPIKPPIYRVMVRYSREWAYGGPIIEREHIATYYDAHFVNRQWERLPSWVAGFNLSIDEGSPWSDVTGPEPTLELEYSSVGATPLIAAMRAYVQSKAGDEIELPQLEVSA